MSSPLASHRWSGPCLVIIIVVTVRRTGIVIIVCIYGFRHKRLAWLGDGVRPSEQLQILFPLLCKRTLLHELR